MIACKTVRPQDRRRAGDFCRVQASIRNICIAHAVGCQHRVGHSTGRDVKKYISACAASGETGSGRDAGNGAGPRECLPIGKRDCARHGAAVQAQVTAIGESSIEANGACGGNRAAGQAGSCADAAYRAVAAGKSLAVGKGDDPGAVNAECADGNEAVALADK